jgi:heterotetrameric sarcosine oxidase gamma subunit
VLKSRSALESFCGQGVDGANDHPAGAMPVRLGEVINTGLLHIGVYPGAAARVAAGASAVLGGPLPDSPVRTAAAGNHLIFRVAPDQYWVLGGGEPALEARLRTAIPADAGCVTSLDGARTRLFMQGPLARDLLGRLVSIDLHPTVFPVGGFAQTGIHHVAGLLLRANEDRYEFFAPCTFAAFTWEVLIDAARPFGYEIVFG